eukprot:m.212068 g.212068  ORF g.212068 m.212068 type:complete len:146 (+) comp15846_c0_seq2:669-1106(+)
MSKVASGRSVIRTFAIPNFYVVPLGNISNLSSKGINFFQTGTFKHHSAGKRRHALWVCVVCQCEESSRVDSFEHNIILRYTIMVWPDQNSGLLPNVVLIMPTKVFASRPHWSAVTPPPRISFPNSKPYKAPSSSFGSEAVNVNSC